MNGLKALGIALALTLPFDVAWAAEPAMPESDMSAEKPVAAQEMSQTPAPETPAEDVGSGVVATESNEPVIVTVDRARVFRISRPAATVIIGNPSIADATIEDEQTLVLTGRSFGVTNLIIMDAAGNPIVDQTLVVRGHETNTVRIYRRSSRETLACAPICEPTLTIGDDAENFAYANEQIRARNDLSAAGAQ
ncbi:MAG: pilus assembly protein N-terminal domain-containing protein [Salaquimonas sp.]|nr:pilus assembly protein N-terminal domain-containing protein [Salaquimonas sp.]